MALPILQSSGFISGFGNAGGVHPVACTGECPCMRFLIRVVRLCVCVCEYSWVYLNDCMKCMLITMPM